jgi:hypothetical protein
MKSMSGLNRKDFVVAYSSIDMVIASITMTLSDKDVLAARNLVVFSMSFKAIAVVIQVVSIRNLSRFDQQCLAELPHPVLASPRGFVWALWIVRGLAICSLIPTMIRVSPELNLHEHDSREHPRGLRAKTWQYLSTTLFTHYLLHISIVFLQGVPAIILAGSDISKSWGALCHEWGQSAALIVAVVACSHVGYTFVRLRKRIPVGYAPIDNTEHYSTDELLTNHNLVGPDSQSLTLLNVEKQNEIWKQWILSVDLGDRRGMLDCLQQGLSRDRSFAAEYPIHMAARFNHIDIIEEAYSDHKDEERLCYERLCQPNQLRQTPLLIAYKGRNLEVMEILLTMHHHYLDSLNISSNSTSSESHGSKYAQSVIADFSEIFRDAIEKEDVQVLDLLIGRETVRQWESITIANSNHCACLYALKKNKIQAATYLLTKSNESLFAHTSGHASYVREEDPIPLYATIVEHFPDFWADDSSVAPPIRASVDLDTICKFALQARQGYLIELLAYSTLDLPKYFLDSTLIRYGVSAELEQQLILKGGVCFRSIKDAIFEDDIPDLQAQLKAAAENGNLSRLLSAAYDREALCHQLLSLLLHVWTGKSSLEYMRTTIKLVLQGGILNAPVVTGRSNLDDVPDLDPLCPLADALVYSLDEIFFMMLQYVGSANTQTEAGRRLQARGIWAVCSAITFAEHADLNKVVHTGLGNSGIIVRCAQSIEYLLQQGAVVDLEHPWGKVIMQELKDIQAAPMTYYSSYDWVNNPTLRWILKTLQEDETAEGSVSEHERGDMVNCDWPLFRPGMAASYENDGVVSIEGRKVINEDFLGEEPHFEDEPEWCLSVFEEDGQYGEFWKTLEKDDGSDDDGTRAMMMERR